MNWLSEHLITAARSKTPLAVSDYPKTEVTLETALNVQEQIAAQSGEIGAWKVAAMGDGTALFAPIFTSDISQNGEQFFAAGEGHALAIECELAFLLGRDITPDMSNAELIDAVSSVHMVVELVGSRLQDQGKADFGLHYADRLANTGFVVGSAVQLPGLEAQREQVLELEIDGMSIIKGPRQDGAGDPLELYLAAARSVGTHCGGFRKGQFITTGSFSGCDYYPVGTTVKAAFPELGGEVALTI
ncbi:hypothetical protein [Polycladidibacter hongkongensis]|uniref:hypothetical protein n=1 Tax=Polycladidibacter hongkongensis TaxID=1647556 RepID=UPI0008367555|nr:hypothetical protein [Pseudovibrio hongkongensis]